MRGILFFQTFQRGADGGDNKGGKSAFLTLYLLLNLLDNIVGKTNCFVCGGRRGGDLEFTHKRDLRNAFVLP